jgi:hypothetical protein
VGVDASDPVEEPFDRFEKRRAGAFEDAGHILAERLDAEDERKEKEEDLKKFGAGHQNFSGSSKATKR